MNGPRIRAVAKARRRRSGPKESCLVTAILKALVMKGVWAWRVNSGVTVLPGESKAARRVIKGAPAGTPDILVVIPKRVPRSGADGIDNLLGCLFGIEVKSAKGRLRPSQVSWSDKARTNGVGYGVARSIGEALELVKIWSAP